tara:strand:+ start:6139 stop:6387 length:249 start_codon:yes stop_codon:yes gene_type:complete
MADVIEIVEAHLTSIGADGLVYPGECGCKKGDLVPCGSDFSSCQPGWIGPPSSDDDGEWAMYVSRERADDARAAHQATKEPR